MKVVKTTKLCARIITRSSWEVRSKDILANLEWETLENKRYNLKDKFMFKVMNGRAPEYIKDLFRPKEQITSLVLRDHAPQLGESLHEHEWRLEFEPWGMFPRENFRKFGLPWTVFRVFSWWRKRVKEQLKE